MSNAECVICRKPKANFECEMCDESVCKNCSQILDRSQFAFLTEVPAALSHTRYCTACYDAEVEPELAAYQETLEKAKQVFVFFTTQRKEIPLIRKSKLVVTVDENPDRDETVLRLGFQAAQAGFNAILETDVKAKKLRNAGYQTSVWHGSAIPADVDGDKIAMQDRVNMIYR